LTSQCRHPTDFLNRAHDRSTNPVCITSCDHHRNCGSTLCPSPLNAISNATDGVITAWILALTLTYPPNRRITGRQQIPCQRFRIASYATQRRQNGHNPFVYGNIHSLETPNYRCCRQISCVVFTFFIIRDATRQEFAVCPSINATWISPSRRLAASSAGRHSCLVFLIR
jgi:hypothetical protein